MALVSTLSTLSTVDANPTSQTSPMSPTTTLKDWQLEGVGKIVEHLDAKRGCLLRAQVGAGKTLITLRACCALVQKQALPYGVQDVQDAIADAPKCPKDASLKVLVVCPASITHQWVYKEAPKAGVPLELFMDYSEPRKARHKRFDNWMEHGAPGVIYQRTQVDDDSDEQGDDMHIEQGEAQVEQGDGGVDQWELVDTVRRMDAAVRKHNVVFCVCSYEMLHRDLGEIEQGTSKLFRRWDVLVIDEAHKFRNGVSRHTFNGVSRHASNGVSRHASNGVSRHTFNGVSRHASNGVSRHASNGKAGLVTYDRIQQTLIERFRPLLVAVSASPVVNHQMDIYSLLRWANMSSQYLGKSEWLKHDAPRFKQNILEFRKHHLVTIKVPPVPPVTKHAPLLQRTAYEKTRAKYFYRDLNNRCKEFVYALNKMMAQNTDNTRLEMTDARNRWLASVTRCSFEELWPGCYTITPPADGKGPPHYSSVTPEYASSAPLPSLNACSKLKWVVQHALQLPELAKTDIECSRVVVFCKFLSPLILLRRLLQQHAPHVPVFEHHGALSREAKNRNIDAFFATQSGGLLLATRASLGVGKNLECSRAIIKLDNDWSQAMEDQATGRVVRPLVQEKHEWHEYTPLFGDRFHASAESFCIQKWMHCVMSGKDQTAATVLTETIDELTDDVEREAQPEEGELAAAGVSSAVNPAGLNSRANTESTVHTLTSLMLMLNRALTEQAPNTTLVKALRPKKTIFKRTKK